MTIDSANDIWKVLKFLPVNESLLNKIYVLKFKEEADVMDTWNKYLGLNPKIYSILYHIEALSRVILRKRPLMQIPPNHLELFVKKKGTHYLIGYLISIMKDLTLSLPFLRVQKYLLECINKIMEL